MNSNVITNFAGFAEAAHSASINAGWYSDLKTGERIERNRGEMYCLMHSEISEAMEGFRKSLQDDKLPHRPMIEVELADFVIRLADYSEYRGKTEAVLRHARYATKVLGSNIPETLTRVHGYLAFAYGEPVDEGYYLGGALKLVVLIADKLGLDLEGAVVEKMAFNQTRKDHKIENRKLAGGKAI